MKIIKQLPVFFFIIIFHTKLLQGNIWKINNLFQNQTLHFVTTDNIVEESNYFVNILHHNSYTPLVLDHILNWKYSKSRYNDRILSNLSIPMKLNGLTQPSRRHPNTISTFVNLFKIPLSIAQLRLNGLISGIILAQENPTYIFLHVNDPTRKQHVHWNDYTLTSKFIFFSPKSSLYIVCIPCENFAKLTPATGTIGPNIFQNIAIISKKSNENLQGNLILAERDIKIVSDLSHGCGSHLNTFPNTSTHRYCLWSTIGEMYNFTAINYQDYPPTKMKKGLLAFFFLNMHLPANETDRTIIARSVNKWSLTTFGVKDETFSFAVITQIPSVESSGFETFLSPFDRCTWSCVVSSLIGILLLFQITEFQNDNISLLARLLKIQDYLYWTLSTLLLQMGTPLPFPLKSTSSRFGLVAAWFFVCILLSMLYQGEIFSYLTAILPPAVPKTMQAFWNSPIKILTTNAIIKEGLGIVSTLKTVLIPDLILGLGENHTLQPFLLKLRLDRLCFVNQYELAALPGIAKNISASEPLYDTNSVAKILDKETFAVLDPYAYLEQLLSLVEFYGGRYIVRNREKTPFNFESRTMGRRNFFHPIFSNALGLLEQSGISQRWRMLMLLNSNLRGIKALKEKEYGKFFGRKMTGMPLRLISSLEPVSINALKYVFALCSVLYFLAGGIFAVQNAIVKCGILSKKSNIHKLILHDTS